MIIQLPRDTTSIVLRFDRSDVDASDPGHTITLLSGSDPTRAVETTRTVEASTARKLRLPVLGARRRTMLACGVAGMLVAGLGVSILQAPRAEPALFQPRATTWNDSTPGMQPQWQPQSQQPSPQQQMPERMRAELDRSPTVVPPDAGPTPKQAQSQGRPAGNPFGLE